MVEDVAGYISLISDRVPRFRYSPKILASLGKPQTVLFTFREKLLFEATLLLQKRVIKSMR